MLYLLVGGIRLKIACVERPCLPHLESLLLSNLTGLFNCSRPVCVLLVASADFILALGVLPSHVSLFSFDVDALKLGNFSLVLLLVAMHLILALQSRALLGSNPFQKTLVRASLFESYCADGFLCAFPFRTIQILTLRAVKLDTEVTGFHFVIYALIDLIQTQQPLVLVMLL